METLQEKIKSISGNKRQFILMRIAGMDTDIVMNLLGITRGTYNSWFKNEAFSLVYHELPALIRDYRQEAVQMLRKNNQLEAVLLEGKILAQLKVEIESGEYVLSKTHLAREVYSKLMSDLDAVAPKVQVATWQQRIGVIQQYLQRPKDRIEGGEVLDAEFEEVSSEQEEHSESIPISESESSSNEDKKEAE